MVGALFWKPAQVLLLLFLADSTTGSGSASDQSISTSRSYSCDESDCDNATDTCRRPEQLESNTKPPCLVDIHDEDLEYCLQQASQGKCSVADTESENLKNRCPKACRTCWSCDNDRGDEECEGNYPCCYDGNCVSGGH